MEHNDQNILNIAKNSIWYPFTQAKTSPDPIIVSRASGCYIYDNQNKAYLDLISSWWVNIHGHGNERIAQAIYDQILQIDHILLPGFIHQPAVELIEELKKYLCPSLSRFFFSDNGSTAVEIGLKLAFQYWKNQKIDRTKFLSFKNAYHGDTIGAMSVAQESSFFEPFKNLGFEVDFIDFPSTWQNDEQFEQKEQQSIEQLKKLISQNQYAGMIIEPLFQGAGGMNYCRVEFLNELCRILKQEGILIIFDEVMTGFYRTGTFFAYHQIEFSPDILCISKALSSGILPLALTISTEEVYQKFYHNEFAYAFTHGHSYTANPIGCKAGVVSLKLIEELNYKDKIKQIQQVHKQGMLLLLETGKIKKVRLMGAISACEIKSNQKGYTANIGQSLKKEFMNQGLILRPLGNVLYFLPPYVIDLQDLQNAYSKVARIIEQIELF